jgi:hypothetical protein
VTGLRQSARFYDAIKRRREPKRSRAPGLSCAWPKLLTKSGDSNLHGSQGHCAQMSTLVKGSIILQVRASAGRVGTGARVERRR